MNNKGLFNICVYLTWILFDRNCHFITIYLFTHQNWIEHTSRMLPLMGSFMLRRDSIEYKRIGVQYTLIMHIIWPWRCFWDVLKSFFNEHSPSYLFWSIFFACILNDLQFEYISNVLTHIGLCVLNKNGLKSNPFKSKIYTFQV